MILKCLKSLEVKVKLLVFDIIIKFVVEKLTVGQLLKNI